MAAATESMPDVARGGAGSVTRGGAGSVARGGAGSVARGGAGNASYGDAFAALYDRLIAKDYSHAKYARYLDAQIRGHGPREGASPARRIIVADLGCGSGGICVELARLGYDMVGIDRSPAMLALAQEKARAAGVDALFLLQDMRSFELFGTVGAIVSTIDAMNYVTTLADLRRVFSLAANYLDPGGVFIFDVNTRYKLESVMGGETFFDVSDGSCLFWECGFSPRRAIATFSITLFARRPDGAYDRHDELHRQRAHSPEELTEAARRSGLSLAAECSFMTARKATPASMKTCYVFRKDG